MPASYSYPLHITQLGRQGDGMGDKDGTPVYVPLTCPGDQVRIHETKRSKDGIRAEMVALLEPSPLRQTPPCRHFGTCGGCSLQHLNHETYQQFKQHALDDFVAGIGLDTQLIAPMVTVTEKSRRRASFAVQLEKGTVKLGFLAPQSHQLVDIQECPISDDALLAILPSFKACLGQLKKPGQVQSIHLTALTHGLDATLQLSATPHASDREMFTQWAKESAVIRLNLHIKPQQKGPQRSTETQQCLYDTGNATIRFADVEVALPASAFLQATEEGERAITACVTKHLRGCQKVADIYSGCGTYSFPLLKQAAHVSAYEGAAEMCAAANNAASAHGLSDRLTTSVRDLYKRPLAARELNHFDGLVINPPRNGALPQVKEIAKSTVPKLVMVSCSASTFKRDARVLINAGYQLSYALPIDQFYWSPHLELVAVFERKA